MKEIDTKNTYTKIWIEEFREAFNKYAFIESYAAKLFEEIEELSKQISPETFWEILPKIIGIDSKLSLLSELLDLIDCFDVKPIELIEWVEKDYFYYNKEICGYSLNSKTKNSIIFNVK